MSVAAHVYYILGRFCLVAKKGFKSYWIKFLYTCLGLHLSFYSYITNLNLDIILMPPSIDGLQNGCSLQPLFFLHPAIPEARNPNNPITQFLLLVCLKKN